MDWLKVAAAARSDPGDTFLFKFFLLVTSGDEIRSLRKTLLPSKTPNYINEWRIGKEYFGSGALGAS